LASAWLSDGALDVGVLKVELFDVEGCTASALVVAPGALWARCCSLSSESGMGPPYRLVRTVHRHIKLEPGFKVEKDLGANAVYGCYSDPVLPGVYRTEPMD